MKPTTENESAESRYKRAIAKSMDITSTIVMAREIDRLSTRNAELEKVLRTIESIAHKCVYEPDYRDRIGAWMGDIEIRAKAAFIFEDRHQPAAEDSRETNGVEKLSC